MGSQQLFVFCVGPVMGRVLELRARLRERPGLSAPCCSSADGNTEEVLAEVQVGPLGLLPAG